MDFRLLRLRFQVRASRRLDFPVPASNKLRGAMGARMRERGDGSYEEFFSPRSAEGPSGLADRPRPFVLRAQALDGRSFESGERFAFDVHLFDERWLAAVKESWGALGKVEQAASEEIVLPLAPGQEQISRIRVEFLTPTELKDQGRSMERPEFGALAGRARDRVGTLRALYGGGSPPLDFRGFGERSEGIRMTRCDIRQIELERRSGRTGTVHPLGGFVGEAEYEGNLREFVPFLRAAEWTGVGRQTTWGKGALRVVTFGVH